jgi:hypothetical protein
MSVLMLSDTPTATDTPQVAAGKHLYTTTLKVKVK